MNEVLNFLNSLNIGDTEPLVIAVSYGPDSMFLLDLIHNKYINNKIICAHVHHNHRSESDEEARLLKEYCSKNNIIFEMMKIDAYKNNKFTEEEARNKRYEFFEEILKKYGSKYLFTAHHGDDLIETVLMKINRGTSFGGYAGISLISKRNNYEIIRPLLYLTKEYINNYCDEYNIPYAVDNSNNSDDYLRNRYRKYVLPSLKAENETIHKKFLEFSNKIKEYDLYVKKEVGKYYPKIVINNKININELIKFDDFIIDKVIEKYLFDIYGENISMISNVHKYALKDLIKNPKPNISLSFPNKIKVVKSYNNIYFDKDDDYNTYCYILKGKVKLPNGYVIEEIADSSDTSNYCIKLDSRNIKLPLVIRNRHDGDKIHILGLNGSKKLKDIFIDEKIDKKLRNGIPVVVMSNGEIIWVPGLKKSKYDKSKTGKYDIILKYYKEENNGSK